MLPIALVTGQMRSGTSLVACILHRLGWFAGAYVSAPIPPSWRSDWEDTYSIELMTDKPAKPEFIRGWIKAKAEMAGVFGFSKLLFKSPYLALYMQQMLAASNGAYVIVTKRNQEAIDASLARHPLLLEEDQARIRKALKAITPNYVFDTDRCQEDPRGEIQSLCMALGFDPGPEIEDAIALVDQRKAQVF